MKLFARFSTPPDADKSGLVSSAGAGDGDGGVFAGIHARLEELETTVLQLRENHPLEEPVAQMQAFASGVEDRLKDMTLAIAEGIERVDRAERRVQASIRRARKELEEVGYTDERLEAEAQGFPEHDARGGGDGRLQPVQEGLDYAGRPVQTGLPGEWLSGDLHRMRG